MSSIDIVLTTYNVLGKEIHYADGAQVRCLYIRLQLAERVRSSGVSSLMIRQV